MKWFHGNFVHTPTPEKFEILENYYMVIDADGAIRSVCRQLPEKYQGISGEDFGNALVIPGFADLHLHASQLPICGLGCDGGADWFSEYCYPAEAKYADPVYAHEMNRLLIEELKRYGIMRANIMCTTALGSAVDLFEQYLESGMSARIGKMNSDRGAFGEPLEDTEISKKETLKFLEKTEGRSSIVKPALCPEFAPACTEEMMYFLGKLSEEKGLPIHSHMAEGDFDVELVRKAFPADRIYGRVYDRCGLFGRNTSFMAHCLNNTKEEIDLMAERGVTAVHCPMAALDSGSTYLFHAREYRNAGVTVGLGSDVGGGHTLNMMQIMTAALHISKQVSGEAPLTIPEVFYMATKGGSALFGRIGSFELGNDFDALIINDSARNRLTEHCLGDRITQFIYCGEPQEITRRFCAGKEIF